MWSTTNKRIIRWALALQEFDLEIRYRKGAQNSHVDYFSRDGALNPIDRTCDERLSRCLEISALEETQAQQHTSSDNGQQEELTFPGIDEIQWFQEEDLGKSGNMAFKKEGRMYVTARGRIYVPERLRKRIMTFYHFGHTGAHQGINKAVARLGKTFWWPNQEAALEKPYPGAKVVLDFLGPSLG
eukprot:GHVQ01029560.1.p1 GENE.GHVQ01029560.1~~GHVQ01029560.1.p1  ORF type:complete len:185 (+),score=12.39 GHVQ01029560.1:222-776(+)